jgi:hypothetical protein
MLQFHLKRMNGLFQISALFPHAFLHQSLLASYIVWNLGVNELS